MNSASVPESNQRVEPIGLRLLRARRGRTKAYFILFSSLVIGWWTAAWWSLSTDLARHLAFVVAIFCFNAINWSLARIIHDAPAPLGD